MISHIVRGFLDARKRAVGPWKQRHEFKMVVETKRVLYKVVSGCLRNDQKRLKLVRRLRFYTNNRRPKRQENASRGSGECAQYRSSRLKLPTYRMKNWPTLQTPMPPSHNIFVRLFKSVTDLRWWQTRTQCCGHIAADTNVSPFARARNICCLGRI